MKHHIDLVSHFMEDFDQRVRYQPVTKLSPRESGLRIALLVEEVTELAECLGVKLSVHINPHIDQPDINPAEALDHLVDIAYVLFGAACTLGLQAYMEEGFEEAHASNMSKKLPDGSIARNELGKVVKGPNYTPANFQAVIDRVKRMRESIP